MAEIFEQNAMKMWRRARGLPSEAKAGKSQRVVDLALKADGKR